MSDHGLPTTRNKVQELQRTLYRAAKADPRRRFHALYDKVYRRDILERAWEQVRRNRGAAGIDGVTLAEVERYGVERLLDELAAELKEESYRVKPSRRVWIPKPGRAERRPLSIPSVRDRIVQAALKLVAEPVFEADFLPCSFGFRPKRAPHDALQVLIDEAWRGRRWVVETDIASCGNDNPFWPHRDDQFWERQANWCLGRRWKSSAAKERAIPCRSASRARVTARWPVKRR